jgi:site-specific recombinase XerD
MQTVETIEPAANAEGPGPGKAERSKRRNPRGIFERNRGEWWIRYVDAQGRYRREKAGTKGAAIDLYRKRKQQALEGRKLPERLRRAAVSFAEIASDALAYSKTHKGSYRDDAYRMKRLLDWFGSRAAESITSQEIENALTEEAEAREWFPGTSNRYRSLLSMTFRLAIRNGKVRENPVRHVARRKENNLRTRFLDADEETALRGKIRELCPEREAELDLALNTGMRRNEQWRLRWQDVNLRAGIITIPQSKHGAARHVPINSVAEKALALLAATRNGSEYVCAGSDTRQGRDWERWFERCVREAGIADFRWHDLRHTFASRLAMAGVPLRTLAELLGHRTLAMVMRYAHLAPAHLRDAVERIAGTPTGTTTDTSALQSTGKKHAYVQ